MLNKMTAVVDDQDWRADVSDNTAQKCLIALVATKNLASPSLKRFAARIDIDAIDRRVREKCLPHANRSIRLHADLDHAPDGFAFIAQVCPIVAEVVVEALGRLVARAKCFQRIFAGCGGRYRFMVWLVAPGRKRETVGSQPLKRAYQAFEA